MTDRAGQILGDVLDYGPKILILVIFAVLLVNAFLNRNRPRVGGKIGRRSSRMALRIS